MKLTLLQFIAFSFMLGWILSEVGGGSYQDKLMVGIFVALVSAYLNNAHGKLCKWLRTFCKA